MLPLDLIAIASVVASAAMVEQALYIEPDSTKDKSRYEFIAGVGVCFLAACVSLSLGVLAFGDAKWDQFPLKYLPLLAVFMLGRRLVLRLREKTPTGASQKLSAIGPPGRGWLTWASSARC